MCFVIKHTCHIYDSIPLPKPEISCVQSSTLLDKLAVPLPKAFTVDFDTVLHYRVPSLPGKLTTKLRPFCIADCLVTRSSTVTSSLPGKFTTKLRPFCIADCLVTRSSTVTRSTEESVEISICQVSIQQCINILRPSCPFGMINLLSDDKLCWQGCVLPVPVR